MIEAIRDADLSQNRATYGVTGRTMRLRPRFGETRRSGGKIAQVI
jgi:hypothetical protein